LSFDYVQREKTLLSWLVNDLIRCLKRIRMPEFKVVVMPDFFLDRFVEYTGNLKQLSEKFGEIAKRKGGTIHGIKQLELRGGNAANTASALAALGAKVVPIIDTSPLGLHIMRFYLEPFGVDLSHVKSKGEMAMTTAFEFSYKGERVNVMMSELGSLPEFGLKDLTSEDFELLQEADYIGVFHWSGNLRWGTELAEGVFKHVKKKGRARTYFDSADPTPKKEDLPRLVTKVLRQNLVDIFSVNENEAFYFASQLGTELEHLKKTLRPEEFAKECARILARNLPVRVDLHTSTFAGSFAGNTEVVVPAFNVHILRATGAGDAWNAGNIIGDALAFPDSCRLTLANAAAAYYISNPAAEHPTLPKIIEFCSKQPSSR
jgi:sugar/nucleoside kinase (ribokinase family)